MSGREFQCPRPDCQKWFRADESAMGRLARCPHCKHEIRVPGTIDKKTLAGSRKTCRVRIESGPAFAGIDIPLDPDRSYTFGRSDVCDQQLPDASVSRRHFSLHWVNSKWVIEDLNTTGGTEVNSLRITKHQLEDGDRIKAGEFELAFHTPHKKGVDAAAPAVLPSTTSTEPIAVAEDPDAAFAVEQADRALRGASTHFESRAEYQEELTKRSVRQYRLSLVTQLLLVVALLAGAGLLSVYGKRLFSGGGADDSPIEIVEAEPEPLPAAFLAALGKRDLEMAAAILQEQRAAPDSSDELAQRMDQRFRNELRDYNGELLRKARDLVQDEDWDAVDQLLVTAANPLLAAFAPRWVEVRRARQLHDVLDEFERLKTDGNLRGARAMLVEARGKYGNDRRLRSALSALEKEMNAGLRAELTPNISEATVSVNGTLLGPAGADYWKLDAGQVRVEINAPGYFRYENDVRLSRGELQIHAVRLRPLPSREIWALDSLRRSGNDSVLWLAAAQYASAGQAPVRRLAESMLPQARDAARSGLMRKNLRVAEVALKDGRRVKGRIWTQTASAGVSMLVLPAGENKTFPPQNIASVSDLPPKDRISVMARFVGDERSRGVDVIETLEVLAALRAQLNPEDAAAFQPAEDLVRSCLSEIESGCARCLSLGKVVCERCEGKGRITERVTCDRCRGSREMKCVTCHGAGRLKCKKCYGKGSIKRTVRIGNRKEKRSVTCPSCSGSGQQGCKTCSGIGQVTCPRCKGIGERDVKVDCPVGERGRMGCPDCGGVGSKDAMTEETRHAAELAAAQWADPGHP